MASHLAREVGSRIRRPILLLGTLVAAAVLGGVSFYAGSLMRPPDWQAASKAAQPIEVWAPVTRRVVNTRDPVVATVTAAPIDSFVPRTLPSPAIVVATKLAPNTTLATARPIANISGRVFIALCGAAPLYRDLRIGDEGPDVLALQGALKQSGLSVAQTGKYGVGTHRSLQKVFNRDGIALRADDPLPIGQILLLGPCPVAVGSAAAVGDQIGPEHPLFRASRGPTVLQVFLGSADAATFKEGQPISAMGPTGEAASGTVGSVGPTIEQGGRQGRLVTFSITNATDWMQQVGLSVKVSLLGPAEAVLAVPSAALRHDDQGTFLIARNQPSGNGQRIRVTTLRAASGYVAISGELDENFEVRLS